MVPAQMNAGEQRRPRRMLVRLGVGNCGPDRGAQDDLFRIWRIAAQQPRGRHLGLFDPPAIGEPERALDHEKTADDDRHGEQDGAGIHPAPGADIGIFVQDQKSDGRARKAANGLKAECRKHHAAANAARNALGDDQMRGRIVASERKADADEGHDHDAETTR